MDNNVLDLLYELKKKCIVNDDTFMTKANLTYAEYHFFIAISKCDEVNSNIIAQKMDLSLSRISRVIDKLVKKGYLLRKTVAEDRRAIKLELTEAGEELKNEIVAYRTECERKIIDNVSEVELEQIKRSFGTVLKLL